MPPARQRRNLQSFPQQLSSQGPFHLLSLGGTNLAPSLDRIFALFSKHGCHRECLKCGHESLHKVSFFSLSSFQSDIQGNLPPDIEVLSSRRSKDTVGCAYNAVQARLSKPGYPSFCWAKSLVRLKLAKGSVWSLADKTAGAG